MGIFSKNKNKLILVFNVGSSNISGALFWAQNSGIPKIIFSDIEPIHIEDKLDINKFLSSAMQSLDAVAGRIRKANMGTPQEVFCVLSSPWHVSQTRIINFKKNTPFIFTARLAESLVQKEISLFEEENLKKDSNADTANRTIEVKNIKTILNGYETSEPLNQKTKELEMTVFISFGEEKFLKTIEDNIAKYFHFNQIRFSSFSLAFFTIVRDMYIQKENFLLLDIGGEVTSISMVKKNILREGITFPIGRNFFTRGVARDLGCTLSEAGSLISLFKDGHAEESVAAKMTITMGQLRTEWLKSFQESLANLSNDISIPATIYLSTDKDLADFFCQTIKSEQFNQYTLTESKFEIIFLDTSVFHGIAVFAEPAIREPTLIINSVYINRFLIYPATMGRV
ncbi:MAG: hypothetical protein P4L63_00250 [Candidatus Pacebacteria bacterium]|nr:hypothetical protein [Candidatus Paceibacterota bacterium]